MIIKIAGESNSKGWDSIVENSPHGTIFHKWKWLKIIEKHTKTKFYPLIAVKGNNILGIFPFFYKKAFLKLLFSPPPRSAVPYLGPVLVDYEKMAQYRKESKLIELQMNIDEFIYSYLKPNYVMICPTPFLIDSRQFKWTGYQIHPRYYYSIDLYNGLDSVWKRIKNETRRKIRVAKKKGVFVEFGCKEELEIIYDLLAKRYVNQDRIIPVSKDLLLDLYNSYPENIKITVAKYKGDIVSGGIDICYKDRFLSWIGNPKTTFKEVSVNDALNWACIKIAYENGFKTYDIIGVTGNQRLYKFHSKYNPNFSMCFSAVKYSSVISKFAEYCYINLLKPVHSKFKLITLNLNGYS